MDIATQVQSFGAIFKEGGPWMVAIALALGFSIALSIERFVRLYLRYNIDGPSFMAEVQKYVLANDLEGAIRVCNGAGKAALPKVVKAGLQRANKDEHQIQNAVDAVSLEMISNLEKRLPYLGTIANVATLLGLLGTITGLIRSFAGLKDANAAQRTAMLAEGISEAMNATAFGLVTAIFTMIAHAILTGKATKILEEIDEFGVKLVDLLSSRKSRRTSEGA